MQNASSHDLFEFEDVIFILIQVDNKSKDSLFLLALCFLIHITYEQCATGWEMAIQARLA